MPEECNSLAHIAAVGPAIRAQFRGNIAASIDVAIPCNGAEIAIGESDKSVFRFISNAGEIPGAIAASGNCRAIPNRFGIGAQSVPNYSAIRALGISLLDNDATRPAQAALTSAPET